MADTRAAPGVAAQASQNGHSPHPYNAIPRLPLEAAETGLLGIALIGDYTELIRAVGDHRIDGGRFSLPGLGVVFDEAIGQRAASDGKPADVGLVLARLADAAEAEGATLAYGIGFGQLYAWAEKAPPSVNADFYAWSVAECAHQRACADVTATAVGRLAESKENAAHVARWLADELDRLDGLRGGKTSGSGLTRTEEEAFWNSRPWLKVIRQFAWARLASPWAALGSVLVRVISQVSPSYVLPPIVGSYASLNLYLAIVGDTGAGKDAAEDVAPEAFDVRGYVRKEPIGTGEGIVKTYVRWNAELKEVEQVEESAVFDCLEVDKFAALMARPGATLPTILREAWTGKREIGFGNAEEARRLKVGPHRYRLCVTLGVQPKRAGVMLNAAEVAGGSPQRYLWLPATDPGIPDHTPEPAGFVWDGVPDWPDSEAFAPGRYVVPVCREAVELIRSERLKRVRGQGAALDSHAPLNREKWAGGFAFADGHIGITEEDWWLAGILMRVSDHTRGLVVGALEGADAAENRKRAEADADRRVVIEDRVDAEGVRRASRAILARLGNLKPGEWMAGNELKHNLRTRTQRPFFDDAMPALLATGQVEVKDIEYNGVPGKAYRLAGRSR